MFEHLVAALVHGSGYGRIASSACSDSTIRRRLRHWAGLGIAQRVHTAALAAYDQFIGLQLTDIPADGCITKAPSSGDKAGPSPVDRRKGGPKRSIATEGAGVPLGIVSAWANRHDSPLLGPTLQAATVQVGSHWLAQVTVHLDAGYDSGVTRALLDKLGLHGEIARKGVAAPIQVSKRWSANVHIHGDVQGLADDVPVPGGTRAWGEADAVDPHPRRLLTRRMTSNQTSPVNNSTGPLDDGVFLRHPD